MRWLIRVKICWENTIDDKKINERKKEIVKKFNLQLVMRFPEIFIDAIKDSSHDLITLLVANVSRFSTSEKNN